MVLIIMVLSLICVMLIITIIEDYYCIERLTNNIKAKIDFIEQFQIIKEIKNGCYQYIAMLNNDVVASDESYSDLEEKLYKIGGLKWV